VRLWLARVRNLFGGTGRLAALATAIAVAQTVLLVPVAVIVRDVFDVQIPAGNSGRIALAGVIILALYLMSAVLSVLGRGLSARVVKRTTATLRNRLLERLYLLPRSWHDRHGTAKVLSLVVSDSERVDRMVDEFVSRAYPAAIVSVALAVVGVALSPLLFGLVLLGLPIPFLLARRTRRRLRSRIRVWQDAYAEFSSAAQTTLRAMTLTKVHGAEEYELAQRSGEIEALTAAAQSMVWAEGTFMAVMNAVNAMVGSLVLIGGGIAVAEGSTTIGGLLSFYAVMALLLRQLLMLVQATPAILVGFESLRRLDGVLEAEDREPYDGTRRIELEGAISFERVSFAYDREPVVHDLDLEIAKGEHVVITGPNGAGKSTLLSLLLGLYRPASGAIRLDAVPLEELELRHVRQQFGVVLQDPVIFPGTVRENIAYAQPSAPQAAVERAARLATAADFIERLPHGYDTEVGDEGELLSGGQRQRIAIARALLGEPRVLLLDEPTTYLDDRAIGSFLRQIEELPTSPTVLIITHSGEVGAQAGRVIQLREGRVVSDERRAPAPRLVAQRSP
jgi:ABC-type multidrug transport system fused ATPase/permease subunit